MLKIHPLWEIWVRRSKYTEQWAEVQRRVRPNAVQVWVDGCVLRKSPGPGGAGVCIVDGTHMLVGSRHLGRMRIGKAEWLAFLMGLGLVEPLAAGRPVDVFSDSHAVIKCFRDRRTTLEGPR